jgi:hypothetical protein
VANAIHVIVPYRHASTWVFDDPREGLSQEPFVSGIPEMIDTIVENIPNAEKGFRLQCASQRASIIELLKPTLYCLTSVLIPPRVILSGVKLR